MIQTRCLKNVIFIQTILSFVLSREILERCAEVWDKIISLIKKISDKPGDYDQKYIKIKFDLDHNLPLNKILKLHNLTVIVRSIFEKGRKYCLQIFLDKCLYKL